MKEPWFCDWSAHHFDIVQWALGPGDSGHAIRFVGTNDEVFVDRGKIASSPAEVVRHKFGPNDILVEESKDHRGNFIESILSC